MLSSTLVGRAKEREWGSRRSRRLRRVGLGGAAAAVLVALSIPAAPVAWGTEGPADGDDAVEDATNGFDSARFSDPTTIDNQYLPLVPGTQFALVGQANRGQGQRPHRVVFTVTDITKEIDGVRAVVVWDRDFQDGVLVEAELSFWAQDDNGAVWNLGEYPEEWEDGQLIGAPNTWLTGVQRARAGVHLQADPQPDTPSYLQGRAPAIDFLDRAKVSEAHQRTCVPAGCFRDVLVTDEWNPLDQPADGHQLKYHAPGVGIVRIEAVGGDEQETLVMTKYETLTPADLAEARAKVFKLDERAYVLAEDVWRGTPRAELAP